MRLPVLLLGLTLALSACAPPITVNRTDLTMRPVPALPDLGAVDVEALMAEYEDEDGVYLNSILTIEHTFGLPRTADWSYISDKQLQYVVLDADAEWLTTQTIRVPEGGRIDGIFSRVTSPDGRVQLYTGEDAVVTEDDGLTTYKFVYPSVERGTLIEESSRVTYEIGRDFPPPLSEDIRLVASVPTKNLEVRYLYPQTWGMQVKRIRPGVIPEIETIPNYNLSGKTLIRYTATDVPAYQEEEYAPYYKETADYLETRVTAIRDVGYTPADSWQEFADEFSDYAFKRGGLFSNPVRSATRQAIPDESVSDSLKLVQIVRWVQTNIEVGSTDKQDLNTVVREQKGNPLLICGLTQGMLDRVGIESEFLLIHPLQEGFFDDTFISPSQFSIPAVRASVDGRDYVVFPFLEGLPVTIIPAPFQGATALRVTPDGFGGFLTIPDVDVETYAVDNEYVVTVREDGVIEVEETQTLRDIAAWSIRDDFKDLDEEEMEDEIRELLTYNEGEIEGLEYDLVGLDEFGSPFEIRIRYTIPNLVTLTPEEVIVQTAGLLSPSSLSSSVVDLDDRQHPIRIYYDTQTNTTHGSRSITPPRGRSRRSWKT
ncbi:MAG: hypothetical protein AAGI52_14650 [Bacteroidota bacterium]